MPRWKIPAEQVCVGSPEPLVPQDPEARLRKHCDVIYNGSWKAFISDLEVQLSRKDRTGKKTAVRRDLEVVRRLAKESR